MKHYFPATFLAVFLNLTRLACSSPEVYTSQPLPDSVIYMADGIENEKIQMVWLEVPKSPGVGETDVRLFLAKHEPPEPTIPNPNDHGAETFPMLMAIASFQDWDAIYPYTFLDFKQEWNADRLLGFFDLAGNSAKLAFAPAAALAFRKGFIAYALGFKRDDDLFDLEPLRDLGNEDAGAVCQDRVGRGINAIERGCGDSSLVEGILDRGAGGDGEFQLLLAALDDDRQRAGNGLRCCTGRKDEEQENHQRKAFHCWSILALV